MNGASALTAVETALDEQLPESSAGALVSIAPLLGDWEAFATRHFPAYLLPSAGQSPISREAAETFLSHFAGSAADLEVVCGASLLADRARQASLSELASTLLPSLVRNLPSTTLVERREWEGGFRGRLDVQSTLALHRSGKPTSFVTRARRRRYDLPEVLLVRAVVDRLLRLLSAIRSAIGDRGWVTPLADIENRLQVLAYKSALRDIPVVRIERSHVDAARMARHPAFAACADWERELRHALDDDETRGAHLARGALIALDKDKRFQVAVLVRLIQCLRDELERREPGRWALEFRAILSGRSEVAALVHAEGRAIRFFYDQAVLEPGGRDALVRHYLNGGRARPDVTLVFERNGCRPGAVVVEAKQSTSSGYLAKGIEEAIVYRHEYDAQLLPWPKAMVVAEGGFDGVIDRTDVIAMNWCDLLPGVVVAELADVVSEQ